MSSRNVAVRKDVYDALRKERRPHESFTLLFIRLMNQRGLLDELVGAWTDHAASADTKAWMALRYGPSGGRRA
jgi:predicted CopG family antitoxin